MRKETIRYTSPLDALIAVAKTLSAFEQRYEMESEDFYDRYSRGALADDSAMVEWANYYRHYVELRRELEAILQNVA